VAFGIMYLPGGCGLIVTEAASIAECFMFVVVSVLCGVSERAAVFVFV